MYICIADRSAINYMGPSHLLSAISFFSWKRLLHGAIHVKLIFILVIIHIE